MPHPFFLPGRLRVFAHRGGAALAPENTIAAFDAGLALGAGGLELDVRLARDGVAVVHHDDRLERTTNLEGPVSGRTSAELAWADAGFHFRRDGDMPFRGQGVGVPTLAQVLARYPAVPVIIELKDADLRLGRAVLDDIQRADAAERVCVGSFSWRALRQLRALAPHVSTSAARIEVRWALYRSRWRRPCTRVPYQAYQVPEVSRGARVVSPRFVDDAHRAGIAVQVWTVDDPDAAGRLAGWGVDAIITDRPDLIVPLAQSLVAART